MPSLQGDLWQVTDIQTLFNQQVLNVYYYRVVPLTGINDDGYPTFVTWFKANVMTPVRAIQNITLNHLSVQVRNLSNGLDFYEEVETLPGTLGGSSTPTAAPPNMCHTFRLIRESLATRNGYKRFAGVDENQMGSGTISLPTVARDAVIAALAASWVSGITLLEPVIPKRPIVVPVGAYVYASIGDAQYVGGGTQNTRKIGRGV